MTDVFSKSKKVLSFIILNVVIIAVLFFLLEGLSSTIVIIHSIVKKPKLAERLHTEYDSELGWTNVPNTYIRDMYGPGVYMQINSQAFRANNDFSKKIADGKKRIICSGDSFTLGYGVDNDNTWCQLLTALDDSLETVNMGMGGYGVDQAYLWFKRDSSIIEHDVHIFAFISNDFDRMRRDKFMGYGKPVLSLEDGVLSSRNVPVPRRSYYVPWLTDNISAIEKINLLKVLRKLLFGRKPYSPEADYALSEAEMKDILPAIFKNLNQINRSRNSLCILLYLPEKGDYDNKGIRPWIDFLRNEALKNGVYFIDLTDEFQKLHFREIDELFFPPGAIDYAGAANHYTVKGNQYIATVLYKKLTEIPEVENIFKSAHKDGMN